MASPSTAASSERQAGATALGATPKRKGLGRLPLLLLVLLLALVMIGVLVALLSDRDGKATNGGTVISSGTDLVGKDAPTGSAVHRFDSQAAVGNQARVVQLAGEKAKGDNGQIVNDDERFFVGSSAHQILVVVGNGTELPQALPPGHRISFNGTVKPYNGDPKSIGIDPAVSNKVKAEGSYIEVDPATVQVQS
ncbi:MAG: hypothetical protein NVS3B12_00030 [Acidimicrobiales bacterium]